MLAAVTSRISSSVASLPLNPDEVEDGALPKDSVMRLAKIFMLHSSLVVKAIVSPQGVEGRRIASRFPFVFHKEVRWLSRVTVRLD